ncbi:MAG: threonine--tRNA ligase [Patescibacteria group bacterium]
MNFMQPNEKLSATRHSLAHLLAAAVLDLWPEAKNTIGPAIETGFYYDFEFPFPISEKDFARIENKMREILKTWDHFSHKEVTPEEARVQFRANPYKLELIDEIVAKGEQITLYTSGTFTDLCRGGHVESADEIRAAGWELSKLAGAYWRGDEKNTQLTRIYGLAFASKDDLAAYKAMMVEAEKRDHRKLGKELDLFTFDDEVGAGLPLWMPNGAVLVEQLEKLAMDAEFKMGYSRVRTPHIAKETLYKTSGHLPYYEDSMYPPMEYEGGKYYLKAMNCPHHHKIFAARPHSYKELPIRYAEYGTVYRQEKSGELFGLMRVRMLTQNDAHIYCTEAQFADEFKKVNDLYLQYFKIFGIDKYVMRFSTHSKEGLGKKYVNEPELWLKTEKMVRDVLIESKINYVEVENEAAFYGPKIDVQVWSAIGREFTLATNQVDFAVPKRFDLTYTTAEGTKETPLCIHRAPLGTHERFIGFLIEHYAGNFPTWLAPTQVAIVPIRAEHTAFAQEVNESLRNEMFRTKFYSEDDGLGKKIRAAKTARTPYTLVIGDEELASRTVTVESRDKGKIGQMQIAEFLQHIEEETKLKR